MKITYDKSADAAYIKLVSSISPGEVKKSYNCDPLELNGAQINLDFKSSNQLIGIEILDASKHLPKEVLDKAEVIG